MRKYGTAISDRDSTAVWWRSRKAEPHDGCRATFAFHLRLSHTWETFTIYLYRLGRRDWWEISYESLMPSPRKVISKLPQHSPEHTIPPAFGRYPCLLDGLPYALAVVTHIKKPEVSLWSHETFLKHLSLYLLRNKIIKAKQLKKVNKIRWTGRAGHRSDSKPLPTAHSHSYVADTATTYTSWS